MRHVIVCECGHDGAYFIVALTEDYLLVRCPECHVEQTLPVGMDQEK